MSLCAVLVPGTRRKVDVRGKRDLAADFNEQLWLPVMQPSMTSTIEVVMMDHDAASGDDRVGTVFLDFKKLRHGGIPPRWYNIYGPQDGVSGGLKRKHFKHYKHYPDSAPNYRGRILMSLREDSNKKLKEPEVRVHAFRGAGVVWLSVAVCGCLWLWLPVHRSCVTCPQEVHKKVVPRLSVRKMPRMTKFVLRALVVSGSELPKIKKLGLVVEIGNDEIIFDRVVCRDGMAEWRLMKEKRSFVALRVGVLATLTV